MRSKHIKLSAGIIGICSTLAIPTAVEASAYYYSKFLIPFLTFEGEYQLDANKDGAFTDGQNGDMLVWARPASKGDGSDSDGAPVNTNQQANFGGNTSAVFGATSDGDNVNETFADHIPLPATFPIDATQAFINIGGSAAPAENTFTQTGKGGINGEFVRADHLIDNLGGAVNAFGAGESAGEVFNLVAEGFLDRPGTSGSDANSSFRGVIDLNDSGLDDPTGILNSDGTNTGAGGDNLGATGRVRLRFDYMTEIDLETDEAGATAFGSYGFSFRIFDDQQNLVAIFDVDDPADNNGGLAALNNSKTITGVDTFNNSFMASFFEIIDLSALFNNGNGIFAYDLELNQTVDGRNQIARVPEPNIIILLSAGLLGLGFAHQRKPREHVV